MRLKDVVKTKVRKLGKNGKAKLAIKADVSTSTVVNVLKDHVPMPETAYKLAKACGCDEEDAQMFETECASLRAKTA